MRFVFVTGALGVALLGACQDPTHDAEVASLGPEPSGETPGPAHRAGEPCLVCHGGSGPASGELVFGGTVYQTQSGTPVPLVGALVIMTDASGKTFKGATNAVGNFYVPASEGAPAFPAMASLSFERAGVSITQSMSTFIGRDGSCATCHTDPLGPVSPGHVWLVSDPSALPPEGP